MFIVASFAVVIYFMLYHDTFIISEKVTDYINSQQDDTNIVYHTELQKQEEEISIQLTNITFDQCKNIIDIKYQNRHNTNNQPIHLFNNKNNECHQKFKHCEANTPFLFSYGGSGNTVTRIIISYITNIYTGSIYPSAGYAKRPDAGRFRGEGRCGDGDENNIVIIKAHPEHLNETKLVSLFSGYCSIYDCVCGVKSAEKQITNEILYAQNIKYNSLLFNGIFIVRNPWNAMWALYQYYFGSGCPVNGDQLVHVHHIYTESLVGCRIGVKRRWNPKHFSMIINEGENGYKAWLKTFELMELMDKYNKTYAVVKFENLVNLKKPSVAIKEMEKMMEYLYLERYYEMNRMRLLQRMECLVVWLMKNDWKRFKPIHRSKPNVTKKQVTIEQAYSSVNKTVICEIWADIEPYAVQYGYKIWNDIKC